MAHTAKVDLVLRASEVRAGRPSPAVSPVWLTLNGTPFPMADWWDFPVVVLRSLTGAVVEVSDAHTAVAKCYFFDGPYYLRLRRRPDGAIRIEAIDEGVRDEGVTVVVVDVAWEDLARTVEASALELLEACRRRRWDDSDVRALRSNVRSLQAARRARGPS
ncbi:MAG: hypothetical protein K1X94_29920 [Sandaracinaceae bacterium]|nr:hypothetical protein [Sandaracinaceae bacterium]